QTCPPSGALWKSQVLPLEGSIVLSSLLAARSARPVKANSATRNKPAYGCCRWTIAQPCTIAACWSSHSAAAQGEAQSSHDSSNPKRTRFIERPRSSRGDAAWRTAFAHRPRPSDGQSRSIQCAGSMCGFQDIADYSPTQMASCLRLYLRYGNGDSVC